MEKITINLENCYGIKKFEKEFDFSNKNAFVIYASNGSMKTSFTKTLKDISEGKHPKEEVFSRESKFKIQNENNELIKPEEIFVIESFDSNFYSKRMSNLLMNKTLQEKYNSITQNIEDKKIEFVESLKLLVGKNISIEEEILSVFKGHDFYEILTNHLDEIINSKGKMDVDFSKISYFTIFDPKVENFVTDDKNYELLKKYEKQYNDLVENSTFLKRGEFSQYNAMTVNDTLNDNGFFDAGHKVFLQNGESVEKYDDLKKLLQKEMEKVLSDPKLLKNFEQIDRKLSSNNSLRSFRVVIENNPELITKLVDYDTFKYNSWIGILNLHSLEIRALVELYVKAQSDIKEIQDDAKKESHRWRQVVDIFSNRFFVPFRVEVSNQQDVVLKNTVPTLSFIYVDGRDENEIDRTKLNNVLSGGEKRALYLLNIIFELEALKKENRKMLVIADDIAESFDYKNKYAIIEYLMEHYSCELFNIIILTHNFDFYRTVGSRMLNSDRNHCLMVVKTAEGIKIKNGQYLKNVFKTWKDKLNINNTVLVASIPFIRNLIEFIDSEEDEDYKLLTKLLHMMNYSENKTTKEITLSDFERVLNNVWKTDKDISSGRNDMLVYDLIMKVADEICKNPEINEIDLENKIALSIAIRLKAEEKMIQRIIEDKGTDEQIRGISSNQTGMLLSIYKTCEKTNIDLLKILDEVSLMTSENIHLNSFMYEPLIDVSLLHLKKLYEQLSNFRFENE